jgi:serpin B
MERAVEEARTTGRSVTAFNDFGVRLLETLTGDDPQENVLLSPVSIALAFSMLLGGARAETEAALRQTFGLGDLPLDSLDRECNALLAALRDPDPRTALAVANGLWVEKGVGLVETFVHRLRSTYEAEIANLDFASPKAPEVINSWVSDRTRGKIPEIVGNLRGTVLLLANALWFKGLWSQPFDPANTEDAEFTRADGERIPCRLMLQHGYFDHAEHSRFRAIRLPYGDGRIALEVFLPAPGVSCREMLGLLASGAPGIRFHDGEGEIGLPSFRAEGEATLNDVLAGLGMSVAFSPQADFSGIAAHPLMISEVLHKVLLEVDEKGSEAVAVTSIGMSLGISKPFRMIVDRPFACAIRDEETGALLFLGWIAEPAPLNVS